MNFTAADIEEFIIHHREALDIIEDEIEFWKTIFYHLRKGGYVREEQIEILETIVFHKDYFPIFQKKCISDKELIIKHFFESFRWLSEVYQKKENVTYKEGTLKFLRDNKVHGLNEEKCIKNFYENAKKYFILYQIYNNKCLPLKNEFQKKVCYVKYGKGDSVTGEHGRFNPLIDLQCSNVYRSGYLRKKPENTEGIVEYGYDESGNMIMNKCTFSNGKTIYGFLLYADEIMLKILYDSNDAIKGMCICKYEGELISEYEDIGFWTEQNGKVVTCYETLKERYQYSEFGILKIAVKEEYEFPVLFHPFKENYPELLSRLRYTFDGDAENCLKGFIIEKLYGDPAITEEIGYVKLNERKRKSTGKDKSRWRRPNYFVN